jgi:hypothetical protein
VLAASANALAIAMPGKGVDDCLNRVDALHAAARQDPDEYNEKKTAAVRERHALHGSRPVFAEAARRVGGKRLARGGPIGAGHSWDCSRERLVPSRQFERLAAVEGNTCDRQPAAARFRTRETAGK